MSNPPTDADIPGLFIITVTTSNMGEGEAETKHHTGYQVASSADMAVRVVMSRLARQLPAGRQIDSNVVVFPLPFQVAKDWVEEVEKMRAKMT